MRQPSVILLIGAWSSSGKQRSKPSPFTWRVSVQESHLAHWGINIMSLEKTEKTMTELQINLNLSYEFDKLTESGANLKPLSGPGYAPFTRPRSFPSAR